MKLRLLAGCAVASASIAAPLLAASQPGEPPESVEFAKTRIGDFDLVAETETEGTLAEPYVREVTCTAKSGAFGLHTDRFDHAGFSIDVAFKPFWIDIDGRRYHVRDMQVPVRRFFEDVVYPSRIDIGSLRGFSVFRHSAADPWLNIQMLLPDLLQARRVTVGFDGRTVGSTGEPAQLRRETLHIAGMREVLRWCSTAVTSDAAYRLHQSK